LVYENEMDWPAESSIVYWARVMVDACPKTDSTIIDWCNLSLHFYVPDAFSPNADGLNDIFRPVANEVNDFSMVIFDRWGKMLFETCDRMRGWDGTAKGVNCESGVYSYLIIYGTTQNPGNELKVYGTVTLLK
jgi:gliding motility-associated-like protein